MSASDGKMPGWNLLLRFVLELAALAGFGYGAWRLADGGLIGGAAALFTVAAVATIWGTFAVPGDPSRSGNAPVPVPGWLRLVIELLVLGGGAAAFAWAGLPVVGPVLGALLLLHLAFSLGRLGWLLRH